LRYDRFIYCRIQYLRANLEFRKFVLQILETILSKASSEYQNDFEMYSETCGTCNHVKTILEYAANVKASTLLHLSRVLAALTYGNRQKMAILTDHFSSVMDFDSFDQDRKQEDEHKVVFISLCISTFLFCLLLFLILFDF